MEEKDFRLLQSLQTTRSITRTAEEMRMTQSAISKRVTALERELGVELLLRSRQGVRFTPAGELVLRGSGGAAVAMERMRQELNGMKGNVTGSLKVGVCTTFARYRLPSLLEEYRAQYPNVKVEVASGYSGYLYHRLAEDALDMAVIRNELLPWNGERFRVRRENYCVVYHRKFRGVPLTDYPYIERRELTGVVRTRDQKRRWLREQGIEPADKAFSIDSITVCLTMVSKGMGWSVVPDVGLEDPDLCWELCRFENGESFGQNLDALYQKDTLELPQVRAFAELLRIHG